jgi:acid phosphatase type 7
MLLLLLLAFIHTSFSKTCEPMQIHIAQGAAPNSMTISWVTHNDCPSYVTYGTNQYQLDKRAFGESITYNFTYTSAFYVSDYIHHVNISNLVSATEYFYVCGDASKIAQNSPKSFTTLPQTGEISFGIIGDLGQTDYSVSTIKHLANDKRISMILHAGDLSYADCNQTLWDSYGQMIEPLASRIPWMVCAGNHEIEFNGTDIYGLYNAFESRYRMPYVAPATFGDILIESSIKPSTNMPYCTPSVFQSEYNYGNSFYSFETSLAHIIYLNPYSNTSVTSAQYLWLERDLASVDRNISPWLIVVMHCPWYSSNKNHYQDTQTILMRDSMEWLFYKYSVNIVFSGHVHAYERTFPVFRNKTDDYGPVYITIGDGGNLEGLDMEYYEQPEWSAFRNGKQYGHGVLTLLNKREMRWEWYKNSLFFKDATTLCNSFFGSVKCFTP